MAALKPTINVTAFEVALRDYLASQAPLPPDEFKPSPSKLPYPPIPTGNDVAAAERYWDARRDYDNRVLAERMVEWAYIYADAQLAARERKESAS